MAVEQPIRVKVLTNTTGLGAFGITVAVNGSFQDFVDAGVTDGATIDYAAFTASQFEAGTGTYDAGGQTLSRDSVDASSNVGGSPSPDFVSFIDPPTLIVTLLPKRLTSWYSTVHSATPPTANSYELIVPAREGVDHFDQAATGMFAIRDTNDAAIMKFGTTLFGGFFTPNEDGCYMAVYASVVHHAYRMCVQNDDSDVHHTRLEFYTLDGDPCSINFYREDASIPNAGGPTLKPTNDYGVFYLNGLSSTSGANFAPIMYFSGQRTANELYAGIAPNQSGDWGGGIVSIGRNNPDEESIEFVGISFSLHDVTKDAEYGRGKLNAFANGAAVTSATWGDGFMVGSATMPGVGSIAAEKFVKSGSVAFTSLPSASSAGAGARYFITDCNTTTFMATAAGGGSSAVPVVSDGTNWKVG